MTVSSYFVAAAEKCNTLSPSVAGGLAVTNGTEVTFTCAVHDGKLQAPITRWIVPLVDGCMGTEITLRHDPQSKHRKGSCGPFFAASTTTTSKRNCYTSVLKVNATVTLAGKDIKCQNRIKNVTLQATIPPGEIQQY